MSNPARLGRLIAIAVGVAAFCMIPWTVFLGFTLPRRYDAKHWSLLWIGFDVILCAGVDHLRLADLEASATDVGDRHHRRHPPLLRCLVRRHHLMGEPGPLGDGDHGAVCRIAAGRLHVLAGLPGYSAFAGGLLRPDGTGRPSPRPAPRAGLVRHGRPGDDGRGARPSGGTDPRGSLRPSRFGQARAGLRSVTNELHGALDSLSFISNDSAIDRSGIDQARRAIEHALTEIESH